MLTWIEFDLHKESAAFKNLLSFFDFFCHARLSKHSGLFSCFKYNFTYNFFYSQLHNCILQLYFSVPFLKENLT